MCMHTFQQAVHLIILVYEEFLKPVLYSITHFPICWILVIFDERKISEI